MGADRAIHVQTESADVQPLAVAKLLAAAARQEQPGLVLLGKQVSSLHRVYSCWAGLVSI